MPFGIPNGCNELWNSLLHLMYLIPLLYHIPCSIFTLYLLYIYSIFTLVIADTASVVIITIVYDRLAHGQFARHDD